MAWNDLTIAQRSQLMNLFRKNGVSSLSEMRRLYDLTSPSTSLVEGTGISSKSVAPIYASGGKIPPQGVEDDTSVYGPPIPEALYAGPSVPYGFYDAPIDWERKKALQHYGESTFKANQVSRAGAMGPYQIMPANWEAYSKKLGLTGSAQDYNNSEAVRDRMMDELLNAKWVNKGFPSDSVRAAKAFMGYNWGSGKATGFLEDMKRQGVDIYHSMDWIDKIPNTETRNYVNYILRERDIPGGKTIKGFETALPHRFDAYPEVHKFDMGGPEREGIFNTERVLDRVYGDGQAFAEGNSGVLSSVWEYLFNKKGSVDSRIKDAQEGAKKYEEVFKSNNPNLVYQTFKDLPKEEKRLFELGRMKDVIEQHEDAKRLYLGYSPKYGTMEPSPYSPTIGKSNSPYQVNSLLTDGEFENLIVPLWRQWKTGEGPTIPNTKGYLQVEKGMVPRVQDRGKTALVKNLPYLSDATLSEGFDDKGHYLSLYDVWDYNTGIIGTPGDNIGKHIGGKPFEIYQRYYLDDWYDIPEGERGNPFIAPAYITADRKASGGKIHIKKKNRGKFTALKKRTGHSASWFKAHGTPAQKKMAIFALNARKWKHGHGGIIF